AAERDAAAERLEQLREIVEGLRIERAEAIETVASRRREAKEALAALREHDAELAAYAETVNRVTVRHESAVAECDRLDEGLAQAQSAVADAETTAEAAQAELDAALAEPRPQLDASARDGLLESLEAAREEEMRTRLETETLRERIRSAQTQV